MLGQASNTLDVFISFRGKANHEIQLAPAPTRRKRSINSAEQVFFGHTFIDDITQALRARLGSKRQAAFFLARHQRGKINAK